MATKNPPRVKASKLLKKLEHDGVIAAATKERRLKSKMRQRLMRKWYRRKKKGKKK